MTLKTVVLSAIALLAFAGNSVLCRLALSHNDIHPADFTGIRLVSGAITLLILLWVLKPKRNVSEQDLRLTWLAPTMLFAYAALFSFAYISLDTGVGALILFGSVQIAMLVISLLRGQRFTIYEYIGLVLACSGLVYLVLPELSKPSIMGFIMMSGAGIAWAVYTVIGQGSVNPLADTAANFVRSILFVILMFLAFNSNFSFSGTTTQTAIALAIGSGSITSGMGYAVWYAALKDLSTSQAGVLQLLVPIIAAIGGVIFSAELLSARLILSACLTLGGILLLTLVKADK